MRTSDLPTPAGPEAGQPDRRPLLSQLRHPVASDSSHCVSRMIRFSALLLVVSLCAVLGAGVALGQVTNTSDEDPPPPGSLRSEVEASSSGQSINFLLGEEDSGESQIDLGEALVFDNSVSLDNSNKAFGPVDIRAPDAGRFLVIENGVDLILRDLSLTENSRSDEDVIDLETTTSSITFDLERDDQTVNVDIIGAGSLIKEGSAALSLTGTNSFSDGITIEEGDLIGDLFSLAGTGMGDIDLAPSSGTTARVVFDVIGSGDDLGATPAITHSTGLGTAVFVKAGSGSFDISSASIVDTVDIRVEAGDLVIGDAILMNNQDFEIDSGATLDIAPLTSGAFSGGIEGAGTVSVNSFLLQLTLSGDMSNFSGDLISTESQVIIDPTTPPTALDFDVEIVDVFCSNNCPLVINDDDGLTFSGDITGNGKFRKDGMGTTILTGSADHTGGTEVRNGTLIGNTNNLQRTITVTNGMTLGFDQTVAGTFTGSIEATSGTITVRKLGNGTLTLGNNQDFAGDLEVEAGELHFANGVGLTNANLTLGLGSTSSRATLSADFDPSVLPAMNRVSIGGNLTFDSDGLLIVDLDDGNAATSFVPTYTEFRANGNVTIDPAAELVVRLQPGDYDLLNFDIVRSTGGMLTGSFDIRQDFFFYNLVGMDIGNTYRLNLTPTANTLAGAATTTNQREVGGALDNLRAAGSGGDPQLQTILDSLNTIQAAQVGPALDALSADSLAAATNVRLAAAARTWRSLSNRLALQRNQSIGHHNTRQSRRAKARQERRERLRRRDGAGRRQRVDAAPPALAPTEWSKPWVAWFEGSGAIGSLDSSDSQDYDYKLVGPILGADTALKENLRVGFAIAGTRYLYDGDGSKDKGVANAVEGTLYGAWLTDPVELLIGARYGHSWIDTDRYIPSGAGLNRVEGDYEGDEYGLYAEFTKAFGKPSKVEIAPLASVAYTHVRWDSFNESGSNILRMRVDSDDVDSAVTSLGFRLAAVRRMDDGLLIRPRFMALWKREWADREREISGQFVAGGGNQVLEGAEMPQDHAEVSLGWEIGYGANANLFIDWSGRFGEDLIENSLALGVRAAW